MKMKISDILRKSNDETMAKIIGAVIAMHIDGISEEEAVELEYPHTLETLQSEMDVDYTLTNADRIRSNDDVFMSVQIAGCIVSYLIQSKIIEGTEADHKELISGIADDVLDWLQSEVEEA